MPSSEPYVKAYGAGANQSLKNGGFEFFTPAKPTAGSEYFHQPNWRLGSPGVTDVMEKL